MSPKMLDRVLSLRRTTPSTDDGDSSSSDESKTRHVSLAFRFANHLTRTGYLYPSLVMSLSLLLILSLASRNGFLGCGSVGKDRVFGLRFFGYEEPGSDFGSLGVPWCRSKHGETVEWTTKDLLKGLEEFVPIYETRPIKNNMFGMGFDHSFGLWFITRWLKPDLMIESGAFKGHSTWVLRQAMPDQPIISLTPRHPEKYLRKGPAYVDGNCTYFAGKDFVDFGSLNWGKVLKKQGVTDLNKVLIFFDDHQNELKR